MPSRRWWVRRAFRQTAFVLVWGLIVVGLVLVAMAYWRRGVTAIAAGAFLACVFRLFLPARRVGWLAVRGRAFDVGFYAVFGLAIIGLAFIVQTPAT